MPDMFPGSLPRTATSVALALCATFAGSCANQPTATANARVLRLDATPARMFAERVTVRVLVVAPDGREFPAKATALQSGTTELVAKMLSMSLARQGCEAVSAPADPAATGSEEDMHRTLTLQPGWRFASAAAVTGDDQPSSQLRTTLEAGDG